MKKNIMVNIFILSMILIFNTPGFSASVFSIEEVKTSHFDIYPESENYMNIGNAFNTFFENPNWTQDKNIVTFTGISLVNGDKALFRITFDLYVGPNIIKNIIINDSWLYGTMAADDLLEGIYMDIKECR